MVICDQFTEGPRCIDSRLETAAAEKEDCITIAKLEALRTVWTDREWILIRQPRDSEQQRPGGDGKGDGGDGGDEEEEDDDEDNRSILTAWPLDDLALYTTEWLEQLMKCYCVGGMRGLTCSVCDDGPGGLPGPKDEDIVPDEEKDDPDFPDVEPPSYQPITFTGVGEVIPLVYGRFVVGANILWISHVSGVRVPNAARIDYLAGLCAGEMSAYTRVWFGDTLLYDSTAADGTLSTLILADGTTFEFLTGSETQKVLRAVMPSSSFFGKTPAYRGLCAVFVRNYPVGGTDGKLPDIRVEVVKAPPTVISQEVTTIDSSNTILSPTGRALISTFGTDIVRYDLSDLSTTSYKETLSAARIVSSSLYDDFAYQGADDKLYIVVSGLRALPIISATIPVSFDTIFVDRKIEEGVFKICVWGRVATTVYYYEIDIDALTFSATPVTTFSLDSVPIGEWTRRASVREVVVYYAVYSDGSFTSFSTSLKVPTRGILSAPIPISSAAFYVNGDTIVTTSDRVTAYDAATLAIKYTFVGSGKLSRNATTDGLVALVDAALIRIIRLNDGLNLLTYTGDYTDLTNSGVFYYDRRSNALVHRSASSKLVRTFLSKNVVGEYPVRDIIKDVLLRAGLDNTLVSVDVSATVIGYIISTPTTPSEILSSLRRLFKLSATESDGLVKVSDYTTTATSVVSREQAASFTKAYRTQAGAATAGYRIGYYDSDNDFARNFQEVRLDTILGEEAILVVGPTLLSEHPLGATSAQAKRLAELNLYFSTSDRRQISFSCGSRHFKIDNGDAITFAGKDYRIKTTTMTTGYETLYSAESDTLDTSMVNDLVATGIEFSPRVIPTEPEAGNSLVVLNIPLRTYSTGYNAVYYGQINDDSSEFAPTPIYSGHSPLRLSQKRVTRGSLVSGLDVFTTTIFSTDVVNEIVVDFNREIPPGFFQSKTIGRLYEDHNENCILVGKEIIQFSEVDELIPGVRYRFSKLFRGKFGTDRYRLDHTVGETVYVLDDAFLVKILSTREYTESLLSLTMNGVTLPYPYAFITGRWKTNLRTIVSDQPPYRIRFATYSRRPFFETLPSSASSKLASFTETSTEMFFLQSAYDSATFLSALQSGNIGPAHYIQRVFESGGADVVRFSILLEDGYITTISENNMEIVRDIHIAIVQLGQYKQANGYTVEAGTRYRINNADGTTSYRYGGVLRDY